MTELDGATARRPSRLARRALAVVAVLVLLLAAPLTCFTRANQPITQRDWLMMMYATDHRISVNHTGQVVDERLDPRNGALTTQSTRGNGTPEERVVRSEAPKALVKSRDRGRRKGRARRR